MRRTKQLDSGLKIWDPLLLQLSMMKDSVLTDWLGAWIEGQVSDGIELKKGYVQTTFHVRPDIYHLLCKADELTT